MEMKMLLGIILTVLIILVVVIVVVYPSMLFGRQQGEQISFREFCFRWSIYNYPLRGNDNIGNIKVEIPGQQPHTYPISDNCAKGGAPDPATEYVNPPGSDPTCVKLCKGSA